MNPTQKCIWNRSTDFHRGGHYATVSRDRRCISSSVLIAYVLYFVSEKVQGRGRKDHAILCACSRHTRNAESPWESKELQHGTCTRSPYCCYQIVKKKKNVQLVLLLNKVQIPHLNPSWTTFVFSVIPIQVLPNVYSSPLTQRNKTSLWPSWNKTSFCCVLTIPLLIIKNYRSC